MCLHVWPAGTTPTPTPTPTLTLPAGGTARGRHNGNLDAAASNYFDGTFANEGAASPQDDIKEDSDRERRRRAHNAGGGGIAGGSGGTGRATDGANEAPAPPLSAVDKILSSAKENKAGSSGGFASPGHRLDDDSQTPEHTREVLCLFFKDGVAFFEDTSKRQRQQQEWKTGMHTYDASDEGPDLGVDGKEEIIRIAEGEPQYVRRFFARARACVSVCSQTRLL